jgi:Holliday junction resolvase
MSASKRKGTSWERAVVDFLISSGWPHAERRALHGTQDKGDVVGIPGVVIEAKSQARHSLAEWLDEAEVERVNASARIGVAWFKRRGHTSAAKGYVLMTGDTFAQLLREAGW